MSDFYDDPPSALAQFSPFSPRNHAIAIIKAKFGGLVPETVTAEECLELMLAFARYESDRADTAMELLTNTVATRLPPHSP